QEQPDQAEQQGDRTSDEAGAKDPANDLRYDPEGQEGQVPEPELGSLCPSGERGEVLQDMFHRLGHVQGSPLMVGRFVRTWIVLDGLAPVESTNVRVGRLPRASVPTVRT